MQSVKAQKRDTTLLYMTNYGQMLQNANGADYLLLIMSPPDSSTGVKVYQVKEYYLNNKPKLIGAAVIYKDTSRLNLSFTGQCLELYNNGHKKSLLTYYHGAPIGAERFYYPNGKLYALEQVNSEGPALLITCNDSTGNSLTENGNGKWIKFDPDFKKEIEEGVVKDSLEEGVWKETYDITKNYVTTYHKGVAISTTDPYRMMNDEIFSAVEIEPAYPGGIDKLYNFLVNNIRYPDYARQNNIRGKVIIQFVVEKDGSLSDIKVIRSPDKSLSDEAVRLVNLLPKWRPGMQNGKLVRVMFTMPISFGSTN